MGSSTGSWVRKVAKEGRRKGKEHLVTLHDCPFWLVTARI